MVTMMNPKTILAKCITLLCLETKLDSGINSKELVLSVINQLNISSKDVTGNLRDILLEDLVNIIHQLINTKNIVYQEIQQSLKIACGSETTLYDAINDSISFNIEIHELTNMVLNYRYDLSNWLKEKQNEDKLNRLMYDLKFNRDNISNVSEHMLATLNDITSNITATDKDIPGLVTRFSIDNKDDLVNQFNVTKEESLGNRVITTPWQALNRMTMGGLRLGEFITVGGLPFNGKSYLSRAIFTGACYYTNPKKLLKNKKKKPLNVIITLEDKASIVLSEIYVMLKGNIDNVKISINEKRKINAEEAAEYVMEKLTRNGYKIEIIQINPDEVMYTDIQNIIMQLESEGYEIHLCLIDYLNLVSKRGLSDNMIGASIQELFRRIKNFMLARNITCITPHQLSSDAMELKRQGKKDLVKLIKDGNFYDMCKTLGKEMDMELFVDKVVDNGQAYLSISMGKHKGINDTPENDKFFILPFAEIGGLRWDIEGKDTSLTRFGATRNNNGDEEYAFYDMGPEDTSIT